MIWSLSEVDSDMSWCFVLCSVSEGKRWLFVFVDIGGIVDHICLNFRLIISKKGGTTIAGLQG